MLAETLIIGPLTAAAAIGVAAAARIPIATVMRA